MFKIKNSSLIKHVLLILMTIAGRRSSSDTIAAAFMTAIVKSLEEKYDFLKHIKIRNITYFEGLRDNAIIINPKINSVTQEELGKAIESIIRVLCMDLEEESGLFFIKELKERLSDKYVSELKECGVDLELLRLEQKHFHEQLEKRKALVDHESSSTMEEIKSHVLNYAWDAVASFKYRNNMCFLYDKSGKLLDKLHLNKIIEYYVRTLTEFGKLVEKPDEVKLTEKEYEFLKMLYERDLDYEAAIHLLHITQVDFNHMVQTLLRYELLQYVSYDEIKLTDKGIEMLEEKNKQTEEEVVTTAKQTKSV